MPDIAQNYWNLGNAVTGFVVLQGLAFLYSLGDRRRYSQLKKAKHWLIGLSIAAWLLYTAALVFCYFAAAAGRSDEAHEWVYCGTLIGQCAVVILTTVGVVAVAHFIFESDRQRRA